MDRPHIAIVGARPRGTSMLERLCASATQILGDGGKLVIHIIDPYPPGSGKLWRTDQPQQFLMNTAPSQTTLFTDYSTKCEGPIYPGPNLYKWSLGECWLQLRENEPPARSAYGHYLEWGYTEICRRAKTYNAKIEIFEHRALATKLEDNPYGNGLQMLSLSNGEVLIGLSAVILAQGHLSRRPTAEEKGFSTHAILNPSLKYFKPEYPADVRLDDIRPREPVLLRWFGFDSYDHLVLLTSKRGGRFEPINHDRYKYHPSGNEPKIFASAQDGIPYHARDHKAKDDFSRHTAIFLTEKVINEFQKRAGHPDALTPRDLIWPLVTKEVKVVYYQTLFRKHLGYERGSSARHKDIFKLLGPGDDFVNEARFLKRLGIPIRYRWTWKLIQKPQGDRKFTTLKEWNEWLVEYLRGGVMHISITPKGPVEAALDFLRSTCNQLRLIVNSCAESGISYEKKGPAMGRLPLGCYFWLGPSHRRVEEIIALMEAGILQFIGASSEVKAGCSNWLVKSEIPDVVEVTTIVDAFIPGLDLNNTSDPLLMDMLKSRQCRPWQRGAGILWAIDIARPGNNIIDANGIPHKRRSAVGGPTETAHWTLTADTRPYVNRANFMEADTVARAALKIAHSDEGWRQEQAQLLWGGLIP